MRSTAILTTAERSADERCATASRVAGVPAATLKTRDANLLLDGFARALTTEWQFARGESTVGGTAEPGSARGRYLASLVRRTLSELSPAFGEAAWRQGCQPILAIEHDPRRLRWDVSYTGGIEYQKLGSSY